MTAPDFNVRLLEALKTHFGDRLPADRMEKLIDFGSRLARASEEVNLTRILDPEKMAVQHFLDSAELLKVFKAVQGPVLDIGTGGGVPGLPLAILRRDLRVVMIDGTAKKIRFVDEWIKALGLKNAEAVPDRAEIHLRTRRYPAAVLRASLKPAALMEILIALGPKLGRIVFMEGSQGKERARAVLGLARRAGYRLDLVRPYTLPGMDKERYLVVFKRGR